jgi:hypothetical protein
VKIWQMSTRLHGVTSQKKSRFQKRIGFVFAATVRPLQMDRIAFYKWVPGAFFRGIKWPGLECDHSCTPDADV